MLRFESVRTTDGEPPFDLEVAPGTRATLIGASGGRRTRLLLAAAGLVPLRGGRITWDGEALDRGDVGLVDEDRSLLGGLTAVENVATRVLTRGPLQDGDWSSITGLLRGLALPEASFHNLAEQLSGGQQQRVAIARALFGGPRVLCLDDPVSELDPASADTVWAFIEAVVAADGAALLVGAPEPDERTGSGAVVVLDRD